MSKSKEYVRAYRQKLKLDENSDKRKALLEKERAHDALRRKKQKLLLSKNTPAAKRALKLKCYDAERLNDAERQRKCR